MANNINATGRNKKDQKHVRLREFVLASDAYRELDPYSRALLVEFYRRYNGRNNGLIHMSYREAAVACNCSEKPIRRALKELQEKGFIKIAKIGAFSVKCPHATEWILTEHPVGKELSTRDFMRWKKADKICKKKPRRT